ncbi:MAG: S1 family peptidase [Vicinamibacterales bacterium]
MTLSDLWESTRRALLLVTAFLGLVGCAAHRVDTPSTRAPDVTSGILRLISAHSLGQGCPIDAHVLLTARHVATKARIVGPPEPVPVIWSDPAGHTGSAWLVAFDARRDLAMMQSDRPFHKWYPRATTEPPIDERVQIVGYDYTTPLRPQVAHVRVLNIVSAHLVLSSGAAPGFSGSCVLDSRGAVVGIFVGLVGGARQHGLAVSVYGEWSDVGRGRK